MQTLLTAVFPFPTFPIFPSEMRWLQWLPTATRESIMSAEGLAMCITVVQRVSMRPALVAWLRLIMLGFAITAGVRGAVTSSRLVERTSITVSALPPAQNLFLWGMLD